MPSFIPSTLTPNSTYTGSNNRYPIISSVYDLLGGTYDSIGYGYDGFMIVFNGQTTNTGTFTAGTGASLTPYTPNTTTPGSFTPSGP